MTARPGRRGLPALLAAVLLVPLLAVLAGPASPARGDDSWPPVIGTGGSSSGGTCTGTCGSDPGSGQPGGGSSSGGDTPGGTWVTGYVKTGPDTKWPVGWGSEWADCKPVSDGRDAIGFSWSVEQGSDFHVDYSTWSYTCDYGKPPVDQTVVCPVGGSIDAAGPQDNPVVGSTTRRIVDVSSAFVRGGEKNPALCRTSVHVSGALTLTAYGHWTLTGTYRVESCTERIFPSSNQKPEILRCGSPVSTTSGAVGTLWCRGWAPKWISGKSFTADDCKQTAKGLWSCPTMAAHVDGGGAIASVLDDGDNTVRPGHIITWTKARPKGLRGVHVTTSKVAVVGGTPYRNPVSGRYEVGVGGPGEAPTHLTYGTTGDLTSSTAAWWVAGTPGKPSVIRKTTWFTAQAPTLRVKVTSIDLATGKATYSTSTTWTPTTGTCTGTAKVTVYRARNS